MRNVVNRAHNLELDRTSVALKEVLLRIGTIRQLQAITRTNTGTLLSNNVVHIDVQGRVNRGNRRYLNIQVQLSVPRRPGRSTTIATALVQTDNNYNALFPMRYVRDALVRSLADCNAGWRGSLNLN